jgi:hypothetical protein
VNPPNAQVVLKRIDIGLSNLLRHVLNTLYQSIEKFKAGKFLSLSDGEVSILVEGLYGQLDCELVGRSSGTGSSGTAAAWRPRIPRVHVGRAE